MNKKALVILPIFILANTAFLSLGWECLLSLFSVTMAISLDGVARYPKFIPFCVVLGVVSLIGIVSTLFINIKISEKYGSTKLIWTFQYISALALSFPALKLWETLFVFLRKIF